MARQFADVLGDLAGGQTYEEINARLAEVTQAVIDTRKAGELSIRLRIKPNGESSVIVTDEVRAKVPEPLRGETLFFTTADGSLRRDDPRQAKLPLRRVPDPEPEQEETA